MKMHSFVLSVGATAVSCGMLLVSGCATDAERALEPSAEGDRVSVLSVALAASSVGAKSVLIDGTRRTTADGKYPCASHFQGICLDFGSALAVTSDVGGVGGLCPSVDLGASDADGGVSLWDFRLVLFSGQGCAGTQLTGGVTPSLVCYDRTSFGVAGTENQLLGERLDPGANGTQVVCVTKAN